MTKELVIASNRHETKVAILEDDQLVEVYFQRANEYSLAGSIHKGRVTRVLPGMQSAFVELGLERDAFLYVSDFFEEGGEDYERVSPGGGEERGGRRNQAPQAAAAAEAPAPREAREGRDPQRDGREQRDGRDDRRGRRGRRRRGRGRGLPEAKFASAGGSAEAREIPPEPEAVAEVEETERIVLPGESIAKYSGSEAAEPDEDDAAFDETPDRSDEAVEAEDSEGVAAEAERRERAGVKEDRASLEVEVRNLVDESFREAAEELRADMAQEIAEREVYGGAVTAGAPAAPVDSAEQEPGEWVGKQDAEQTEAGEAAAAAEESGEPAQGAAQVLEQPHARYIQRGNRRVRRRGGRDRGDRGERGDRPAREGMESGRTETVARPEREGGRPDRDADRERPAAPPSITDLLKEGQEIIVQIAKEPLGQKGARITSHVALPGRYVVYMPTLDHLGVSRKISTDEERQRLKRVIQQHSVGMMGGFIVRTAGEGKSEADLAADMTFLFEQWMDIRKRAEKRPAPCLLYHDLELVTRTLRDQVSDQFKAIWTDNEEVYEAIVSFLERFQPNLVSRVKLYSREEPIFDTFNITAELEKALRPKVWLKSGGYIVINQTEALVAIDINTGKYVGKSNRLEDTIVKTNLEAVKEIVRQIRLRDLGGIIVVDFIDMDERKNRQKVMQGLEEAMRVDRAPYKILQYNDFGLVAITRRRVKQSLERALCAPCPTCEGAGYVKSSQTIIGEVLTEAHKIASAVEGKDVMLRVNPEVAKQIKAGNYLAELEEILKRPVIVKSDPVLHPEKFDLS